MNTLLLSALGSGAQLFFYILIGFVAFNAALIVDNYRQSKPPRRKPKQGE